MNDQRNMLPAIVQRPAQPTLRPLPQPAALGAFELPSLPSFEMPSTTTLLLIGGAALVAWWYIYGFTSKRQAKAKAKLEYEKKLQQIEAEYTTGGRIRSAGRRAKRLVPKVSFS